MKEFYSLQQKGYNPSAYNLTELNAAREVDRGFFSHNDWLAHAVRYGYAARLMEILSKKKPINILDIGCGNVQFPYYAWRNRCAVTPGTAYWGVDLRAKQEWLEDVGFKGDLNLVRADIISDDLSILPNFPQAFDLVICFETMEHVPRSAAPILIKRLYDWAAPGARILMSTPNAGVSSSTADNHTDPDGSSREWSYPDKVRLCTEVGFEILDTLGTFCGTTRLPQEVQDRLNPKSPDVDRELIKMKKLLGHTLFTVAIAASYPQHSNNSLFDMRKPDYEKEI